MLTELVHRPVWQAAHCARGQVDCVQKAGACVRAPDMCSAPAFSAGADGCQCQDCLAWGSFLMGPLQGVWESDVPWPAVGRSVMLVLFQWWSYMRLRDPAAALADSRALGVFEIVQS